MPTIYLTFDDGPLAGTDDVIAVLNAQQVRGTLFMVGDHVSNAWRRGVLRDAHASAYVQVANHSRTHAHDRYRDYYAGSASDIVTGFNHATRTLGITTRPVDARLPGRNTWRAGAIVQNDRATTDSVAAADALRRAGFRLYGWDAEWLRADGHPDQRPREVADQIARKLRSGTTTLPDKVVLLMHDTMFRASRTESGMGGRTDRQQLSDLIDILKREGYGFDFIRNYLPGAAAAGAAAGAGGGRR